MTHDEAVIQLHRAAFDEFVSERKRLASELKASGDKDGAARLAKLPRPPVSAWAVNQLWWHDQPAFQQLMDAAERVKSGDREASKEHRQLLAELRERAAELLRAAGNAAAEATLRKVTTTLSAVAAAGSFAPDPPGALAADRDPPGFETLGVGSAAPHAPPVKPKVDDGAARRREEAERKRAEEEERRRRQVERERLTGARREAQELHRAQQREVQRLESELEAAQQNLAKTTALLSEIDEKLGAL